MIWFHTPIKLWWEISITESASSGLSTDGMKKEQLGWRSFSDIAEIIKPGWSPNATIVWTLIRQGFEELLCDTPTPLVGQQAFQQN